MAVAKCCPFIAASPNAPFLAWVLQVVGCAVRHRRKLLRDQGLGDKARKKTVSESGLCGDGIEILAQTLQKWNAVELGD